MLLKHTPEETRMCISTDWCVLWSRTTDIHLKVSVGLFSFFFFFFFLTFLFIKLCNTVAQASGLPSILSPDLIYPKHRRKILEDGGWGTGFKSLGKIRGDVHTLTHPMASIHVHTNTPVTKSALSLSFSPSFSAERLSVTMIRNGQSRIKHRGDEKGRDGR